MLAADDIRRGHQASALERIEGLLPEAPVFKQSRRATLLVLRAEALHGLSRIAEAHVAIRVARDHVLAIAATAADAAPRTAYPENVAPAAGALVLAREWTGADDM